MKAGRRAFMRDALATHLIPISIDFPEKAAS